jgi:hypothetical protein
MPCVGCHVGAVHSNEFFDGKRWWLIADDDTRIRGKRLVVLVDDHEVFVSSNRPKRPRTAGFTVMYRRLNAQAFKVIPVAVSLVQFLV